MAQRLAEVIAASGIAATPVGLPVGGLPGSPHLDHGGARAVILRDLPVPPDEVFTAYRRAWQQGGWQVRQTAREPPQMVADDRHGYRMRLGYQASGELVLSIVSPGMSRRRSGSPWPVVTGLIAGSGPQVLLTVLVMRGLQAAGTDTNQRSDTSLLWLPNLYLLPLTMIVGGLCVAFPRHRTFGTAIMIGMSIGLMCTFGVCVQQPGANP